MGNNAKVTSIRKVFATNVKRMREDSGLSQERFAEKIGFHRTYVSALEGCKRNVSLDNIEKIAKALKVKPTELLEP